MSIRRRFPVLSALYCFLAFALCSCGGSAGTQSQGPDDALLDATPDTASPVIMESFTIGERVMEMPESCDDCKCTDCANSGTGAGLPMLVGNVVVSAPSAAIDGYWLKAALRCTIGNEIQEFGLFLLEPGNEDLESDIVDKLHVGFEIQEGESLGLPVLLYPSLEAFAALRGHDQDTGCDVVVSVAQSEDSFADFSPEPYETGDEEGSGAFGVEQAIYLPSGEGEDWFGVEPYSNDLYPPLHFAPKWALWEGVLEARMLLDSRLSYEHMDDFEYVPYAALFDNHLAASALIGIFSFTAIDASFRMDLNATKLTSSYIHYDYSIFNRMWTDTQTWKLEEGSMHIKDSFSKSVPFGKTCELMKLGDAVIDAKINGTAGIKMKYEIDGEGEGGTQLASADVSPILTVNFIPMVRIGGWRVEGQCKVLGIRDDVSRLYSKATLDLGAPEARIETKTPVTFDTMSGRILVDGFPLLESKGMTCKLTHEPVDPTWICNKDGISLKDKKVLKYTLGCVWND